MNTKFHKLYTFLAAAAVTVGSLGFTACSDDDEITGNKDGVVLKYFGEMPATRGDIIEIHGKGLNKVKSVVFPVKEEVTDFTLVGTDLIKVTVPEEALAGHLRLVTQSGDTVTSKSLLSYAEEITVSDITPLAGLLPGDVITVTGDCVYNVASVIFSNGVEVPSTEFVSASRRELKVAVPRQAQTGPVTFTDGNTDEPWEYTFPTALEIISPEVSALDKAAYDFCEPMVISGKNLQYVDAITFPGGVELASDDYTISEDGTTIKLEVPEECADGEITLTLASGQTIVTPAFTLPLVTIEKTLLNGEEVSELVDLEVGNELRFEGQNLDRVKRLFLPKATEKFKDFTLEGSNAITFKVNDKFQDGDIVFYQNSCVQTNIGASMLVALPYIWKGEIALGGWSGNLYPATWDAKLWAKLIEREGAINKPGVLTIYFNHDDAVEGNHILKLTYGDWSTPWTNVGPIDAGSGGVIIAPEEINYKVEITQADIDRFIADGSFVMYGCGLTLTSLKYEPGKTLGGETPPTPSETEIQVFTDVTDIDMGTSLGALNLECKPATQLVDAGMEPGNKLRIYITPTAEYNMDTPAVIVKIFDGHWGPLSFPDLLTNPSPNTPAGEETLQFNEVSWGDMTKIEIPITTELYKALQATDWGYGLILQGQNLIFNKIVLVQ